MKFTRRKTHLTLQIVLLVLILSMISASGPLKIIDNISSEVASGQTPAFDIINYDIRANGGHREISEGNYTSHFFPIYIKSNEALKGLRGRLHGVVSGRGTEDDPYVISGWEPQWRQIWKFFNRCDAIHLENIDKHVLIKNNYIHGWNLYDPGRYPYGTGISIQGCSNITIEYNLFTNNIIGLNIGSSRCIVRFNIITENAAGIVCGGPYASVVNNSICYNTDCGIICNNGRSYVAFNKVFSNGENGIRSGGRDRSYIEYNEIYDNDLDGINFGETDDEQGESHPIISHNIIYSNAKFGVCCRGPTETIIKNNSIYSNHEDGIYCYKSNPTIIDNTLSSNGGYGIHISGDEGLPPSMISHNNITSHGIGIACAFSNWIITYNIISKNSNKGIDVGDSQPHIHYNNFDGNGLAVDNFGYMGRRTNATLNWWGAFNGPSGEGHGSGDPISNWVDYIPWLTEPNPTAGPR